MLRITLLLMFSIITLPACGGDGGTGDPTGDNACTAEALRFDGTWGTVCTDVDSEDVCRSIFSGGSYRNPEYHPGYVCSN